MEISYEYLVNGQWVELKMLKNGLSEYWTPIKCRVLIPELNFMKVINQSQFRLVFASGGFIIQSKHKVNNEVVQYSIADSTAYLNRGHKLMVGVAQTKRAIMNAPLLLEHHM